MKEPSLPFNSRAFSSSPKKALCTNAVTCPSLSALPTSKPPQVSMDLPILDILHGFNHTIHDLGDFLFFIRHNAFKIHS